MKAMLKRKALFIMMLILAFAMTGNMTFAADGKIQVSITAQYGQTEARTMLSMINSFRTGNEAWAWDKTDSNKVQYKDLKNLTYDYGLEKVAMQRAAEIALGFEHERPNGEECFTAYAEQGLSPNAKGENIAAGQTSASEVFTSWQETDEPYSGQGHRRNMLAEKFTAVGIGHVYYNGTHFWVQEFGSPASGTAQTAADDSVENVNVEVAQSKITSAAVTASPQKLTVASGGATELPQLDAKIQLAETWPGGLVPVEAPYTWRLADSQYASVSGGKLAGGKAGTTNLTTSVTLDRERSVTVPVQVTAAVKKTQTIAAADSFTKTEGDAPFQLNASAKTKLTYGSNNESVATVSNDGTVTVHSAGTAVITITAAATDEYQEAVKKITVMVKEKNKPVENPKEVIIDALNFPDENFRACVETYDTNRDGSLSVEERNAVTYIGVGAKKITRLDGIEYFMSLEILDCCGNQLTNLDISKNLELKELRCSNNKLTSIDVSNCALLEDLRCDYNHLGGLDVSTCAALKRLECDYSKLSRLDVRNCTALESLNCEGNPLGDLDVSQNSLLKTLNCQFNQLSSVDVRQNTILESLFCGNNQLRSLDVSQNAKLKKLGCNNNRLNSLDISQNSMLEGLSCQVNPLSSLDVSHNPSLKDLYCYYIALSDLDVSNNLELEHLSCEKNDLSSLHVGQNLALKTLDCSENQLRTLDVTRNLVLMDLRCSENQLKSLDVSSCLELQALWCENNQLKSLDTSKNLKLTSLKDKPQNVSQDEGKQFITVPRYFITKTIEDQDFSLGAVLTVGDGKLSYESDNPDTTTISVDGTVAIHGAGTAVITITAAATEDYEEATKKVTIAVNGKNEPAVNPDTEKLGNPKLTPGAPATWDCVWFGHYPQSSDGNGGFKKEPIKWRVLSVEGDEALLLADKNLDSKPYNEAEAAVTWETSTIRSWLNGYDGSRNLDGKDYTNDNFMGKAFTTEERAAINQKTVHTPQNPEHETDGGKDTEDKLFFLSIQEATNPAYGFADSPSDHTMTRRALNTDYSNPQGKATYRGLGSWWLRSPGQTSWFVIDVKGIGNANLEGRYHRPSSRYYCDYNSLVRPALRLNLKSNLWSYAGTVSSDGKADEIKQGTGNATASVQNPTPLGGVDEATWDCVWLGHYPQSSDKKGDFKEEPIKWRVLSVDGNEALLLADKILDHKRYNETETCVMNWEKSTVRSWLNGYGSSANKNKTDYGDDSFLGAAFTSEEQAAIKEKTVRNPKNAQYDVDGGNDTEDKVFLLSIEEAMNPAYGFASDGDENSKTRRTANTAYAKSHGAYTDKSKEYAGNGWWWLRSPGNYASYAATVWYDGIVHQSGSGFVSTTHESVRPALRLDLHSNVWSYAGTVSSDGTVNEVPAKMASDPTDPTTEEPESKPTGPATAPTTDQPATESTQPATQEPPATEPVQPPAAAGDEGQNTKPPTASKPQKPKAVALKKVSSTKKGALKLTWKKDTKATGYQAMVATDKKFKKNKKTAVIKKNKTVTKTFTKLKRKKTYYAKVRAYKQVGKTKVYGAYSKVKKAKVK